MRTLLLMRHAKSDWSHPELSDHDRPLNKRGRRAAPLMARLLLQQQIAPDVILVSTARRTQETLELMRQQGWAPQAVVISEKELYRSSPQTIRECLAGLDDQWESAMVIGHNPELVQLVSELANQSVEMPTAAVAVFQSPDASWRQAARTDQWQLLHLWKPRELEGQY